MLKGKITFAKLDLNSSTNVDCNCINVKNAEEYFMSKKIMTHRKDIFVMLFPFGLIRSIVVVVAIIGGLQFLGVI